MLLTESCLVEVVDGLRNSGSEAEAPENQYVLRGRSISENGYLLAPRGGGRQSEEGSGWLQRQRREAVTVGVVWYIYANSRICFQTSGLVPLLYPFSEVYCIGAPGMSENRYVSARRPVSENGYLLAPRGGGRQSEEGSGWLQRQRREAVMVGVVWYIYANSRICFQTSGLVPLLYPFSEVLYRSAGDV